MKLHPLAGLREAASRAVAAGTTVFFAGLAGAQVLGLFDVRLAFLFAPVGGLLGAAYGLAYYLRFEYELGAETLGIRSGVFGRTDREIPLHRVQNVDLRQSFLQRLLGVAAVRVETAGGGQTEAVLDFVARSEALGLQRDIRRRKGTASAAEAEEPSEQRLFQLGDVELALFAASSFRPASALLLVLAAPFGWEAAREVLLAVAAPLGGPATLDPGALASAAGLVLVVVGTLLAALTSWAVSFLLTLLAYHGFVLSRAGDDLVYERGLLRRYSGSIPTGKVQTLTVTEPILARRLGYAGLRVETAGYGGGEGGRGGSSRPASAVPLATRERVLGLARTLETFDPLTFTRPPARARRRYAVRYLLALLVPTLLLYAVGATIRPLGYWFVPLALAPLAPVAAHYKWAHRGYHVGPDHVAIRSGFWRRRTRVVPYYRLQTVETRRTLFQRRLGLASLVADTASSGSLLGSAPVAHDVSLAEARRLHRRLRDRLAVATATRRSSRAYSSASAGGSA